MIGLVTLRWCGINVVGLLLLASVKVGGWGWVNKWIDGSAWVDMDGWMGKMKHTVIG